VEDAVAGEPPVVVDSAAETLHADLLVIYTIDTQFLTLDRSTLEYVPRQSPRLPALESARAITDVGERIKTLFNGNDRVGQFLRETIAPTLVYAAQITPAARP